MADPHRMKVGDHKPTFRATIRNSAGVVDLSLANTIRLRGYDYDGTLQWNLLLTAVAPATSGVVEYNFDETADASLVAEPLRLRAQIIVTWADGEQQTFPVFGWFRIIVGDEVLVQ